MKVEYVLEQRGNQRESMSIATDVKVSFCCDTIQQAWNPDDLGVAFDSAEKAVSICGGAGYEMSQGFLYDCVLKFCPFCAEPIEVVQVAAKDRRIKACGRELKLDRWIWGTVYCREKALSDNDYCGKHAYEQAAEVLREA